MTVTQPIFLIGDALKRAPTFLVSNGNSNKNQFIQNNGQLSLTFLKRSR
jgi:hypothetical protein